MVQLSGIVTGGVGVASSRNEDIWHIFLEHVPALRGYLTGTLNVMLDTPFATPDPTSNGCFRVPIEAVPEHPRYGREGFTFIMFSAVNTEPVEGLIYRPDGTCHPDTVVELMSSVRLRDRFGLDDGDRVTITIDV